MAFPKSICMDSVVNLPEKPRALFNTSFREMLSLPICNFKILLTCLRSV